VCVCAQEYFGISVAIWTHDVVVVGGYGGNGFATNTGAAYAFERDTPDGLTWTGTELIAGEGGRREEEDEREKVIPRGGCFSLSLSHTHTHTHTHTLISLVLRALRERRRECNMCPMNLRMKCGSKFCMVQMQLCVCVCVCVCVVALHRSRSFDSWLSSRCGSIFSGEYWSIFWKSVHFQARSAHTHVGADKDIESRTRGHLFQCVCVSVCVSHSLCVSWCVCLSQCM